MPYPLPPSAVDLTFEYPAFSSGATAVDLTFGATLGPPPGTVYAATLSGKFTLRGTATLNYNVGVWRGLQSDTVARHQTAIDKHKAIAGAWAPSAAGIVAHALPFDSAPSMPAATVIAWSLPMGAPQQASAAWGTTATPTGASASNQWQAPNRAHNNASAPWQRGMPVGRSDRAQYGHGKPAHRHDTHPWQKGRAHQSVADSRFSRSGKPVAARTATPWQQTLVVVSYGGPRFLPLPAVAPPVRPDTVVGLQFCQAYSGTGNPANGFELVFGRYPCTGLLPAAPLYILPARFYMAVHQIEARLLPSLAPLPIFDVSLSADSGSFGWSFSASAPPDAFDALTPIGGLPTSIRITLDGLQWVMVVDSLQRTEQFGKRATRISGRSATALVGSPYSREIARLSTTARNAQQLAAAALDLTGVALDWGIDDWLVPAGAWSHSGTPLAAVQAIAEAAGGYVNSHRSDPTLLVRHPYPTLPGGVIGGPWNWAGVAVPDVELAPSAIITSSIDRRDGPDVDGVYVSGTAQGVLAHVKRMGTAGAKLASMISDPLITSNIAAQQRGLSVLGAAGAKHLVQISLPVLTGASQPGVLDVGQLVQINEATPWRGRVRSVSVQAAQPKVRQTITLERHLQ